MCKKIRREEVAREAQPRARGDLGEGSLRGLVELGHDLFDPGGWGQGGPGRGTGDLGQDPVMTL